MSIVKMNKVTLYGAVAGKAEALDGLQSLGCLHLVSLRERSKDSYRSEPLSSEVHEALKYLKSCKTQRRQSKRNREYQCHKISHQALNLKNREQELNDERDQLLHRIDDLRPWGEFALPDSSEFGRLNLWFFILKKDQLPPLKAAELIWQVVAEHGQSVYVVVLSEHRPKAVPSAPISLDDRPLSELRTRLEEVEEQLEELHWQRVSMTRWSGLLAEDLDQADDEAAKRAAADRLFADEHVFAVQGWAPQDAVDDVRRFAADQGLALSVETPQPTEKPPTLLRNPRRIAGAEGAVTFYITPEYRDWDPTPVVYLSFSLFFAMIMADAGYGILLAGLLLFAWPQLGRSAGGLRFRNLLLAIVTATVAYGVIAGSYFGLGPPAGSALDSLQLKLNGQPVAEDRDVMMALSIIIGVAHLTLANLIVAWRLRGASHALGALGWAGILLGGLMFSGGFLDTNPLVAWLAEVAGQQVDRLSSTLLTAGETTAIFGVVCVFLFSSKRPLFSIRPMDWLWRILDGVKALTGFSQAFGDVLSYLRLFALGLATAQLAATFNELAAGAVDIRGPGLLLAVIILVVGHGINVLLGVMGGVVHGLRLNCIEFFNWSLHEEGYPFRAFCKKAGQ